MYNKKEEEKNNMDISEKTQVDDSMNDLCQQMNYTQIQNQPSLNFINDLNIIINEIIYKIQKFNIESEFSYLSSNSTESELPNLDIYELLVSCGHALTWSIEYELTQYDFNWLKTDGKDYFLNKINEYVNLNTPSNYYKILPCYTKLVELYELQVI